MSNLITASTSILNYIKENNQLNKCKCFHNSLNNISDKCECYGNSKICECFNGNSIKCECLQIKDDIQHSLSSIINKVESTVSTVSHELNNVSMNTVSKIESIKIHGCKCFHDKMAGVSIDDIVKKCLCHSGDKVCECSTSTVNKCSCPTVGTVISTIKKDVDTAIETVKMEAKNLIKGCQCFHEKMSGIVSQCKCLLDNKICECSTSLVEKCNCSSMVQKIRSEFHHLEEKMIQVCQCFQNKLNNVVEKCACTLDGGNCECFLSFPLKECLCLINKNKAQSTMSKHCSMGMSMNVYNLTENDILNDTDVYQDQYCKACDEPMEMAGCTTYADLTNIEKRKKFSSEQKSNSDPDHVVHLLDEIKQLFQQFPRSKGEGDPQFVRKSLATLNDSELQRFKDAYTALNNQGILGRMVSIHQQTMVHGTPYFFHWHRWFIAIFESALNANGSALPYWDVVELPRIRTALKNFMPAVKMPTRRRFGFNMHSAPLSVSRHFDPSQLPSRDGFLSAMTNNYFVNTDDGTENSNSNSGFSYDLELVHNQVHMAVGGNMNDIRISPTDCLFWMHHANIDLSLQIWNQVGNSDTGPIDVDRDIPDFTGVTVRQLIDSNKIITDRGSGYSFVLNDNWQSILTNLTSG
jgi:hypothetical protein